LSSTSDLGSMATLPSLLSVRVTGKPMYSFGTSRYTDLLSVLEC